MKKMTKLHFLIVDDNELVAEMHKNILQGAGFKVTITTRLYHQ